MEKQLKSSKRRMTTWGLLSVIIGALATTILFLYFILNFNRVIAMVSGIISIACLWSIWLAIRHVQSDTRKSKPTSY